MVLHDQNAISCTPVEHSGNILLLPGGRNLIEIDTTNKPPAEQSRIV